MAGILDDYFNPALYGGQGGGILSRLPELLAQQGPSQGFGDTQQGAPGSLDPRWLEWLKGGPVPGQAPAQAQAPPSAQAPIFPPGMGTMGGAAGYGAGMDASPLGRPETAQLPPTAMPVAGQGMPAMAAQQQPQMPAPQAAPAPTGPGFMDRLSAGTTNLSSGGNPLAALVNSIAGFSTGQRTDRTGLMLQQQHATMQALTQAGIPPAVAQAAALNPELLKTIAPEYFGGYKPVKVGTDQFGGEQYLIQGPGGKFYPVPMQGGAATAQGVPNGEGAAGSSSYLAPGVKQIDSSLTGDTYLKQFSPEVQAAVNNYVAGQSMPTGNPRKGFTQTIKMIAQKYGQDTGQQVDDATFAARRTMRTQLSSAAPNSLGGQVNVGNTAIGHLSDLSEKALALGNKDIGWKWGSEAINEVRGWGTEQAAKMDSLKAAAQHYGQEVTKFYAGSPGGTAERDRFMEAIGAAKTPQGLAAVISTEAELMHSRLKALESQISGTLGPQGSEQYPVVRPESQKALEKIDANVSRLKSGSAPAQSAPAVPTMDRAALEAEARKRGLIK